jgi:ferredoxin-NADP reductase
MRPLRLIDNWLNTITMYRLVLYGLGVLVAVAVAFGFMGVLPYSPLALLESLAVLLVVCYGANRLLATLFDALPNAESSLVTALILFFVLMPPALGVGDVALIAAAGLVAMASKYVLAVRRRHIFNPAAVGAFAVSATGLYAAGWWIATPVMLPFALVVGLLVVRKVRRVQMAAGFTAVAVLVLIALGWTQGVATDAVAMTAFASWPIIFFATIMLTEPATQPPPRYELLYAGVLGILFSSQLHWGALATTPQAVLLVGNAIAFMAWPRFNQRLRLVRQVALSEHVSEFQFQPERPLRFEPGQYLEFTLPHARVDGRGNRRTFSIASAPGDPLVRIGVKFYEPSSSFKAALRQLKPGGAVMAGSLAGSFTLPRDPRRKLLLMAGGIGITPFRSMLADVVAREAKRDIVLLYSAASAAELSYGEVLEAADAYGVKVVTATEPFTAEAIRQHAPDHQQREAYLSGPRVMVDHYRDLLVSMRQPRGRIHTDYFSGY